MKLNRILGIILAIQIVALGIMIALPAQTVPQPASAQQSDKFDGECTGNERVGRCADKCPNPTDTLLDFDEQGRAICRSAPTGCPYGDSIPLGAECDKHIPAEPVQLEPMEGK